MTPLLDQQLAGFVAKLSTIAVLWSVAFVIMTRAQSADVDRAGRAAHVVRRRAGDRAGQPPASGGTVMVRNVGLMSAVVMIRVRGQADADGTSDGAVSDRTSFGLRSPTPWSPRRPSTPATWSSRSARAAGAFTFALARRDLEVVAVEQDPVWADRLRREVRRRGVDNVTVVCCNAAVVPDAASPVPRRGLNPLRCDDGNPAPLARRHAERFVTRRTWSCSGRWRENGLPRRPARCCPPCGRRGGASTSGARIPASAFRPVAEGRQLACSG